MFPRTKVRVLYFEQKSFVNKTQKNKQKFVSEFERKKN